MNRLGDLQRATVAAPNASSSYTTGPSTHAVVPVVESAEAEAAEDPLEKCFTIVATVQRGTRELQAKTAELRVKAAELLRSLDPKGDGSTDAVQAIMDEANLVSKKVKIQLDLLQAETKRLSATPELAGENAATVKIQENQHAHLSRGFLQAMQEYKHAVAENEANMREQTARRIKLQHTGENGACAITDERASQMAQEMLDLGAEDAVLDMAKGQLAEILETREDLKKMERSMRELHQIFNDLAVLVNEQSELMDQVLHNVQTSNAYVERGREHLNKAKKYNKKSRTKMMWLILCVGMIGLMILAVILGATV